ncbi:hypothetical protein PT974_05997 [Cladobotryum mycophilum]|uniref:Uncharacterized protein n=1 Tax=Cladobotryum mycophilum TaxID=491253 RepID=A0ABR0SKB7_9HYPO
MATSNGNKSNHGLAVFLNSDELSDRLVRGGSAPGAPRPPARTEGNGGGQSNSGEKGWEFVYKDEVADTSPTGEVKK